MQWYWRRKEILSNTLGCYSTVVFGIKKGILLPELSCWLRSNSVTKNWQITFRSRKPFRGKEEVHGACIPKTWLPWVIFGHVNHVQAHLKFGWITSDVVNTQEQTVLGFGFSLYYFTSHSAVHVKAELNQTGILILVSTFQKDSS